MPCHTTAPSKCAVKCGNIAGRFTILGHCGIVWCLSVIRRRTPSRLDIGASLLTVYPYESFILRYKIGASPQHSCLICFHKLPWHCAHTATRVQSLLLMLWATWLLEPACSNFSLSLWLGNKRSCVSQRTQLHNFWQCCLDGAPVMQEFDVENQRGLSFPQSDCETFCHSCMGTVCIWVVVEWTSAEREKMAGIKN